MSALSFVDVFVDAEGRFGNPLAIHEKAVAVDDARALAIAAVAGTSETVFIDDARTGRVRIFVPTRRVPFAGHPLIGVGWFLHQLGYQPAALIPDAALIPVSVRGDRCTIRTLPGLGVPWRLDQLGTADAVMAASSDGPDRHDYVWSWIDERQGTVRARAFTSVSGTVEDEATGSAAVELCATLGRPLTIVQGRGSVLEAVPDGDAIRLTGRVHRTSTGPSSAGVSSGRSQTPSTRPSPPDGPCRCVLP